MLTNTILWWSVLKILDWKYKDWGFESQGTHIVIKNEWTVALQVILMTSICQIHKCEKEKVTKYKL